MSHHDRMDRDDFLPGMYDGSIDPIFSKQLEESGLSLENRGSVPPALFDVQLQDGQAAIPMVAFIHAPNHLTLVSSRQLMAGQTATVTRRGGNPEQRVPLQGVVETCRPGKRADEKDPFFITTFTITHGSL